MAASKFVPLSDGGSARYRRMKRGRLFRFLVTGAEGWMDGWMDGGFEQHQKGILKGVGQRQEQRKVKGDRIEKRTRGRRKQQQPVDASSLSPSEVRLLRMTTEQSRFECW